MAKASGIGRGARRRFAPQEALLPRSWLYIPLIYALLATGCASTAERDASQRKAGAVPPTPYLLQSRAELESRVFGPVAMDVNSALPIVQSRDGALLASSLALGGNDGPLRYRASYALTPGDIAQAGLMPQQTMPSGLAEQRISQQAALQLPKLAGAPLALAYTRSTAERWTLSGESEQRRQVASLRWAPEFAELDLRWAGAGSRFSDPDLALACDVQGDLRLPLSAAPGRGSLQFSGRGCEVVAVPARFAGLDAHSYRLAYAWQRPGRESRFQLAAISPVWREDQARDALHRSYEMGLAHTRRRDGWSATAETARREHARAQPAGDSEESAQWITRARLGKRLPAFSVAANWSHGHDPHWFLPGPSRASTRLGLELELSRWARRFAPSLAPELSVNWHWNQSASTQRTRGEQELRLFLSAFW